MERPDTSGKPRPARLLLKPKVVSDDQKRSAERTSTQRTVLARAAGQERSAEVPLINLSRTGLQISTGQPIAVGAELLLEVTRGKHLRALTRWCRPNAQNYLVGLQWVAPISVDEVWKIRSNYES